MTQAHQGKSKPKRFSSYFSKILGKRKKHKRSCTDGRNDTAAEDITSDKKRSKCVKESKRFAEPSVAKDYSCQSGELREVGKIQFPIRKKLVSNSERSCITEPSSPESSLSKVSTSLYCLNSKKNGAYSKHPSDKTSDRQSPDGCAVQRRLWREDSRRDPLASAKQFRCTKVTEAGNPNLSATQLSSLCGACEKPLADNGKSLRGRSRQSRSFTTKDALESPLRKIKPQKLGLSVYDPSSAPSKITVTRRCVSVGNVNQDLSLDQSRGNTSTQKPGQKNSLISTAKSHNEEVPQNLKRDYLDMKNISPKVKCTSLLDLTSQRGTDSVAHSPNKSTINRVSSHRLNAKRLTEYRLSDLSVPPDSSQQRHGRIADLSPKSMIESPVDSDYVVLSPQLPETSSTFADYEYMKSGVEISPRRKSTAPGMFQSKSANSLLDSSNYHGDRHQIYENVGSPWSDSPKVDYKEVQELLTKLRKSLREKVPDRVPAVSFTQQAVTNSKSSKLSNHNLYPRSKSVEPLTTSGADEAEARNAEHVVTSRSRSRARNIAKRYNMCHSSDNLIERTASRADDLLSHSDYVNVSPIAVAGNAGHGQVRKPRPRSARDFTVASHSNDFYHLNVFVADPWSMSRAANAFGGCSSSTSNGTGSKQPQIFYALDV